MGAADSAISVKLVVHVELKKQLGHTPTPTACNERRSRGKRVQTAPQEPKSQDLSSQKEMLVPPHTQRPRATAHGLPSHARKSCYTCRDHIWNVQPVECTHSVCCVSLTYLLTSLSNALSLNLSGSSQTVTHIAELCGARGPFTIRSRRSRSRTQALMPRLPCRRLVGLHRTCVGPDNCQP